MRRNRKGAPNRGGGRIREAVKVKKSRRDDHEEAASEQQARTQVTMLPAIGSGVADQSDHGCRGDERPLDALVQKVPKSEERHEARDKRQAHAVNRAGRRNDNSSPLPARSTNDRTRGNVEHPVTLPAGIATALRVLDGRHRRNDDWFLVLYEPAWSRLESFE